MSVDFENIYDHIIPMNDWGLKHYDDLPQLHLEQLKPLDKIASKFLWSYILDSGLHDDVPFKADFFKTIDKAKNYNDNEQEVKKWLYHRGLPFDKQVFLSWQPDWQPMHRIWCRRRAGH